MRGWRKGLSTQGSQTETALCPQARERRSKRDGIARIRTHNAELLLRNVPVLWHEGCHPLRVDPLPVQISPGRNYELLARSDLRSHQKVEDL